MKRWVKKIAEVIINFLPLILAFVLERAFGAKLFGDSYFTDAIKSCTILFVSIALLSSASLNYLFIKQQQQFPFAEVMTAIVMPAIICISCLIAYFGITAGTMSEGAKILTQSVALIITGAYSTYIDYLT